MNQIYTCKGAYFTLGLTDVMFAQIKSVVEAVISGFKGIREFRLSWTETVPLKTCFGSTLFSRTVSTKASH